MTDTDTPKTNRLWVRLLRYKGSAEWISQCKARSLPEGINMIGDYVIEAETVIDREVESGIS